MTVHKQIYDSKPFQAFTQEMDHGMSYQVKGEVYLLRRALLRVLNPIMWLVEFQLQEDFKNERS